MASDAKAIPNLLAVARTGIGVPVLLLLLLSMVVLPLPPLLLDGLFTFNITLSLIIILAVVYVARPLDFGVFPTVLLGVTLLRLALNVASTRVVLLNGHTGSDAAGKVIEAFGAFVVGGNYAVGLVVFSILVIINFVVVTKGAGRVSEVSARFTLDAMPGKQMAIDADLSAGIITQEQALARRNEIREEADFYGAMDGASKFVRGDAVAGILILFINIIGGLAIGTLQHDLPFADAMRIYTLLTIGDGLVAQIPSLLLSTSVAIIVTRMSSAQALADQIVKQLLFQPQVLFVAGAALALLGMLPGMPNLAFLSLAGIVIYGGFRLQRQQAAQPASDVPEPEPAPAPAQKELSWDDVASLDVLGLEVGYRLIPLVDRNRDGPLLGRIKGARKKLSEELGFLVQPVHIKDNLELAPNAYRITVLGVSAGEGEIQTDRELAINPGQVTTQLRGAPTTDPAFGLPAYWIEPGARENAQTAGFTVVDASTVVATHLSEIIRRHSHELLGHEEVQKLLDRLAETAPKLVENLVPGTLALGVVVKILQELLAEKVPIRNLRTICETLAERATSTQDPVQLLAAVRQSLSRGIAQGIYGAATELPVITLDPQLEKLLKDAVQTSTDGPPSFEPGLADRLHGALVQATERLQLSGQPPVLLVAPVLRPWLSRLVRHSVSELKVLAYGEIPPEKSLKVVSTVGA